MSLLRSILDPSVSAIFGAPVHHSEGWYVTKGEGSRSLGTVAVVVTDVWLYATEDHGIRLRITFTDATGSEYRLSVTDLNLRQWCSDQCAQAGDPSPVRDRLLKSLQRSELFVRIGLARHWEKHPDRCHLQITGVY